MFRQRDAIGVVGLVMLVCGVFLLMRGDHMLPMRVAWLVGPLLWYVGFAVVIVWMLLHLSGISRDVPECESHLMARHWAGLGRFAPRKMLRGIFSKGISKR